MSHKLNNIKAFSLVEIAIVVTIIGIILGGMLDVMANTQQKRKIQDTNYILDKIQNALYSYKYDTLASSTPNNINPMLPCPAYDTTGFAANANSGGTIGQCPQKYGLVPFSKLNLPPDFMYDAWGRLITYVIVENACALVYNNSNAYSSMYIFYEQYPNCNVYSGGSTGLTFSSSNTGGNIFSSNAVYMLMSHGKSGYGSMIVNGSGAISGQYLPSNYASADKIQNAKYYNNNTTNFVYRAANDTQTNYYDDIIRYDDFMSIVRKGRYVLGDSTSSVTGSATFTIGADRYNTDPTCQYVSIYNYYSFTENYWLSLCDNNYNCLSYINLMGDSINIFLFKNCIYNRLF